MSEFTTFVYDENDTEHLVTVEYEFTKPKRATYWEPAEGGVEIESVTCRTHVLTSREIDVIEQRVIDILWEDYYETVRKGL